MVTLLLARGVRFAAWAFVGAAYGNAAVAVLRSFDGWASGRQTLLLTGFAGLTLVALVYLWARRRSRLGPDV